jgi:hypothetical protein
VGVLVNFLNGTSGRDKIDLYGRQIGYQVDAREGDDIVVGTDQTDFLAIAFLGGVAANQLTANHFLV